MQTRRCVGTYQHREAVAKLTAIDQNGSVAADATAQNPPEAQQRPAPAHLAVLSSAVADDLAVGTQHRFLQRNRGQNRIMIFALVHATLFTKLPRFVRAGKYLVVQEASE